MSVPFTALGTVERQRDAPHPAIADDGAREFVGAQVPPLDGVLVAHGDVETLVARDAAHELRFHGLAPEQLAVIPPVVVDDGVEHGLQRQHDAITQRDREPEQASADQNSQRPLHFRRVVAGPENDERGQRARQAGRDIGGVVATMVNVINPSMIVIGGQLSAAGEHLLRTAVQRLGLSARAYHRTLRLARTIADLEGSDAVRAVHVGEAIGYRSLDRRRQEVGLRG